MRRLSLVVAAALACAAAPPLGERWHIIGPGGGGSLYHPTVSPHDHRTALVACDMTGAYITHDGGATWRIFNLGAPVQFFVFDPLDAHVIYASAGGVFRSGDAGATFRATSRRSPWGTTTPRGCCTPQASPAVKLHHGNRPRRLARALPRSR